MKERPRKFPKASHVPNGKPINKLINVAMAETCSERSVMLKISVMDEV
jgi:hypothetical protein